VTDSYAGLDLLADVFEDTEDAPKPLWNWYLTKLHPSPEDPRWVADMILHPCADGSRVTSVQSIRPAGGAE